MPDSAHSIYGPSGASRWRLCPGSVRVIEEAKAAGLIPERQETEYSKEGTEAHKYADDYLTGKISLDQIPVDFREHLTGYINHCEAVVDEAADKCGEDNVRVFNETLIPLFYRPQDRGTVDHAVICPVFIHITDLKYGKGVKVEALDNDQAIIYAKSFIDELEIMEGYEFGDDLPVFLTIYQPRHWSFDGEPDTWETTVGHLRKESRFILEDYKAAQNAGEQDCTPSEKACKFCDVKGVCRARAKTSFGGLPAELDIEADFDFETDTKPAATKDARETLTPGQIAWICANGSTIKKIIDDVTKAEIDRLKQGGEIRAVKLISGGPGNRCWADPVEAEKVVKAVLGTAEAYKPRQLLSAPQVLTKIKPKVKELSTIRKVQLGLADAETMAKSKTQCLIHRPEGAPKLVPVDHPGEALTFTQVEDDFEVEG